MKKLGSLLMALLMTGMMYQQGFAQNDNSDDDTDERRKVNYGTRHNFGIDLGINNYLENGSFPDENNEPYSVRSWGSWYVALKSINKTHVGGAFYLEWGADVSWYNFKFLDENLRIVEGSEMIEFTQVADDRGRKSKLTASYLNASFVPVLDFGGKRGRKHRFWDDDWDSGFRIGAGVYGGYRIGSYTKNVIQDGNDRDRDRDRDNFYLNNWRYGARLQLGFRGVDFFVNYDLNELFAENRGPELNAFSFGVTL
ncbi:MAG: hypothetical protein AAFX87_17575 [Bacteroidota bacterium]